MTHGTFTNYLIRKPLIHDQVKTKSHVSLINHSQVIACFWVERAFGYRAGKHPYQDHTVSQTVTLTLRSSLETPLDTRLDHRGKPDQLDERQRGYTAATFLALEKL